MRLGYDVTASPGKKLLQEILEVSRTLKRLWHVEHPRHNLGIEKGPVLSGRLHQKRKSRELPGACVNVDADEVPPENVLNRRSRRVELVHIHIVQQVKPFVQDMPRAAGRIYQFVLRNVVNLQDRFLRSPYIRLHQISHPITK